MTSHVVTLYIEGTGIPRACGAEKSAAGLCVLFEFRGVEHRAPELPVRITVEFRALNGAAEALHVTAIGFGLVSKSFVILAC